MTYAYYFIFAMGFALLLTPVVKIFARKLGAIDTPRPPRNLHKKPTPRLGGLAVYLSVSLVAIWYLQSGAIDISVIPNSFLMAMFLGGAVLMVGGIIDDKYELPAYLSLIFPIIASLIVVWNGIGVGITFITNPFGGQIDLTFAVLGIPASAIFSWLWMMGMMYTTKILDGIDGLVGGIGVIASFALFALSLTSQVNQPVTATLAIVLAGALVGYLFYAFHPASIFLGEGGSTYIGFMLGLLAIILGGKIATALLVMGVPIFDLGWVIVQRIYSGKSIFKGDRLHLHFRILDLGFSQKTTVVIMYVISAVFGGAAVFLQSRGKVIALGILAALTVILVSLVAGSYKKKGQAKV